jgi:hypothetical protein
MWLILGRDDRLRFAAESLKHDLSRDKHNKRWVVPEIATPQPPWLPAESKEPLEANSHHPFGRLLDGASKKVEGSSDASKSYPRQLISYSVHPQFLFRHA